MKGFPLSKTLDLADLERFPTELALVDQHFHSASPQDPHRRWEYLMALRAWTVWRQQETAHREPAEQPWRVLDVGGAASPLARMFEAIGKVEVQVCDPLLNQAVEDWAAQAVRIKFDAIVSISTIEHVKDPVPFLAALAALLVPGGLLFLTTDYWDLRDPDTAHFHWMRERIYNKASWARVYQRYRTIGFQRLGRADSTYHGSHLYGSYTFASMALIKEGRLHDRSTS